MKYFIGFLVLILVLAGGYLAINGFKKPGVTLPIIKTLDESKKVESSKLGEAPSFNLKLPEGFRVGVFAKDLGNVRHLVLSPEGTIIASLMGKGEITALPDRNNDGVADEVKVVVGGLDRPHGFAFYKNSLYVTEATKVSRYNFDEESLSATLDKVLFNLPSPGSHFTRSIVFDDKGTMYVSLGSSCNACVEKEPFFASVIVSDADGRVPRLFAKGLRNSVALAINPETRELWGADNGRDLLGDNLPPEEVNIIKGSPSTNSGSVGDYGWPYCYGNRVHDSNFDRNGNSARCSSTEPMIYGIGAHMAPLGMAFINSAQFPEEYQGDLLVALHGSWNRSVPDGYKVVRLKVNGNNISGEEDFLSGFYNGSEVLGRPVGLTFDKRGSLYVSDDKFGVVYKIVNSR